MTEPDSELLTRDVDGTALEIHGTPRQTGARLSRRFKKVAAAALGLVSVGILVGIFTAGNHATGGAGSSGGKAGTDSAMVGQTQPDLDAMERSAHQRELSAALGSTTSPSQGQGATAAAARPAFSAASPEAAPEQKYRQWLADQRYKVLEDRSLAEQSAVSAKLAPEGADRASAATPAASTASNIDNPVSQLLQTAQTLQSSPEQIASSQNPLSALATGPAAGSRAADGGIPSTAESQVTNRSFLDQQSRIDSDGYLTAAVQPPLSDYELFAGAVIPAVLVTGIQSDLPGSITALVRQTVYDSRRPNVVLIPQGARLVGLYTSQIAYGQQRVLVAWSRLIFPNGSTLELAGMQGTDSVGQAGLADQVNNHYARIFGAAVLMSLLGAGAELSQPQNSSALSAPSMSQQTAAAVANELNQVGTTLLNKNLAIQPTITIRPGYAFDVFVNRTIVLRPYAEQN